MDNGYNNVRWVGNRDADFYVMNHGEKEVVRDYFQHLFEKSKDFVTSELKKLGWEHHGMFQKRFTSRA